MNKYNNKCVKFTPSITHVEGNEMYYDYDKNN